jgi:hypothetical protein
MTRPAELHCTACTACLCGADAGEQLMFTRRRQESVCLQGSDYKRPVTSHTTCPCAAADVECDYGYIQDSPGSCKALPQVCSDLSWTCRPHASLSAAGSGRAAEVCCISWLNYIINTACTLLPPLAACCCQCFIIIYL